MAYDYAHCQAMALGHLDTAALLQKETSSTNEDVKYALRRAEVWASLANAAAVVESAGGRGSRG